MVNTVSEHSEEKIAIELAALISAHKGEATIVLDVRLECGFADFFIITTARSARHLQSLAGVAKDFVRQKKMGIINNTHRSDSSGWTLVDCGTIIVHIFEQQERSFYELEKLWFQSKVIDHSSKSS